MAKLGEGRTSALSFDGSVPLIVNAGEVTLNTASGTPQVVGKHVVPWDCSIVKAYVTVRTASTVTSLTVDVGNTGSTSAYLSAYRYDASAAGVIDIPLNSTQNSSFVSASVTAGKVVQFSFNYNPTSASGVVGGLLVLSPNV